MTAPLRSRALDACREALRTVGVNAPQGPRHFFP